MLVYLTKPVATVEAADSEFRLRGIKGRRCPPSMSDVIIYNPRLRTTSPPVASITLLNFLALTRKATVEMSDEQQAQFDYPVLVDFSLHLPALQVAFSKPLNTERREALGLSSGRVSGKNTAYVVKQPSIARIKQIAAEPLVLPGWKAPAKFGSINSARALLLVRKMFRSYVVGQITALVETVSFPSLADKYLTYIKGEAVEGATAAQVCHYGTDTQGSRCRRLAPSFLTANSYECTRQMMRVS